MLLTQYFVLSKKNFSTTAQRRLDPVGIGTITTVGHYATFTSVPALWVLGLLFILPVVAYSYELVDAFTNMYGENMHLNMSFSNFTFICDTFFQVFNDDILPNVFALIGIISNFIDGCDINSLSTADQLSLYRKLAFYLPILDRSVDLMVLNLDILQDTFNNYTGTISDNYITEFASIDAKVGEFTNLFNSLVKVFRDLENGLLMRNLINDPQADFLHEPF